MIKTYYGSSIYADVKKTLAENGLGDKVYVCEPNQPDVAAKLQNGTCPMPCVFPSIESKYIVSPSFDTFTTTGADGESRIHTFDFQNSMPVMLKVYFTVLAFTIPELEEIEACLSQRYSQPCKLSWTGLPKEDDTLAFTLSPDKTKDIQREGADKRIGSEQRKLYQSVIFAKVDLGVEIVQPYSQTQIELDNELQLRLVKKIKVLDVICEHFNKRKAEMTAAPSSNNENDRKFMEYALSVIPNVRADLIQSLKIPAIYARPEAIKKLCEIMGEKKCNVKSIIEKSEEQRKQKEEKAAQQAKATADRNEQIQAIKTALDLSLQIANKKNQLNAVSAQTFKAKPVAPIKQQIVQPQYPAIKPQVPFWSAELLPALIFWPWIIIYYFGGYQTKLKEETERIRNTPEYQQQCAAINEAHRQRVAAAEEKYQAALKQYNEKTLPEYEKELAQWTSKHTEEVAAVKAELDKLERELAAHYDTTKIVPIHYRSIDALRYIYDAMRSSNYTIAQAISSYEQAVQRQIEMERLEEERRRAEAEEARLDAEERAAWAAEEAAAAAERAERNATRSAANAASASNYSQPSKPQSSSKKKSLWGTAMCPYGKKSESGVGRIHCDIGCPLYRECGGRR